ncbi:PilN domain-containing protein [Cryptosporangium sp. NPDC051539]|uniref:PilN domain-containing protein n=1 Tax=Cryptosporangium sp. NPDC051539 TaxID=3363962 RepID=UPI0037AEF95B
MTAMMTPPVSGASTHRLYALGANLLPPEIAQQRQVVRIRLIVLASIGTVIVLLAAWFALSKWQTSRQEGRLADAETQAIVLRQQQRQYGELINAQTQSTRINNELATLLATDVQWSTLFAKLRAAAPGGLELTGITVALTDPTTQGTTGANTTATTASGLPSADGKTPIGSLTINGTATSKPAIATYADAIGKLPGVGNVMLSGVTVQDGGSDFTIRIDLSQSLLSHHYSITRD